MGHLKFKKYWVSLEIYGHQFNAQIDMTWLGDIGARYESPHHWLPEFGDWKVVTIEGQAPFILEVGVKRKGGKRTSYFRFDVRDQNLVEENPVSKEEVDKLINSMAKKIFQ